MNSSKLTKGLSFLMALFLMLALLPSVSFAAPVIYDRTLYYSSADSKLHFDSDTGPEYTDNTGKWSGNGSTLTLNGFEFYTTADCALVVSGTLEIKGSNTLEASKRSGSSAVTATILSYSSLIITGDGSLTLKAADDAYDSHPERCIYTYVDLTISGSVAVNAYAGGDVGARTVDASRDLFMSGGAALNSNSDGPHSGWSVLARNLSMAGTCRIYANSLSSSGGGGIRLSGNLAMSGGEIYAKCLPVSSSYAVALYGTIPSNISISGSDSTSFDGYLLNGALTKLYPNGITGTHYRAIRVDGVDGAGIPNLNAELTNIRISAQPEYGRCSLIVEYYDGAGNPAGVQTIDNIVRGSFITEAYLNIPAGYVLKNPFLVTVSSDSIVRVTLEKVITFRLTINYVDENSRQIGSEVITAPKDAVIKDSDFNVPSGYELRSGYSQALTADKTITVSVYKVIFTLTVEYRDSNNWLAGTERISAVKDSYITDSALHAPVGYKLKDSFSKQITKDETIFVTVVKSAYLLTVQYRDENNWLIGTELIQVSIDPIVTVTERNLSAPTGYRLKEATFSKQVSKDETVSVTVVKTNADFNASSWAQEELKKANEAGLIPADLRNKDLTLPVSRAEFSAISVRVYEALSGFTALPSVNNPFSDTKDSEVLKAYNVGITNGTSATTFSPDSLLSREQAATMLTRVFKRVTIPGWTLAEDGKFTLSFTQPSPFADDNIISDWAKNSVYFMVVNNIMKGMGNNMFAPRNATAAQEAVGYANTTREQAILIALRMTQNL